MKILFLHTRTAAGSGGRQVSERNLRLLQACAGADQCRSLTLHWQAFYPLRFLSGCGSCGEFLRLLLKLTLCSAQDGLRLRRELRRFSPELLFLDNSTIRLPKRYVPQHCRRVVFLHNIEAEYERQRGGKQREAREIEAESLREADACICLNRRDAAMLERLYGRSADGLLPISFEDRFPEASRTAYAPVWERPFLLFVGSDFFGNTDGLFRFIEQCMDRIPCDLLVVGSGMERYSGRYPGKNVFFLGYAAELAPYYLQARAVVLPISSGSGMKTKTCEALMYGKRIFGTREAFEGYDGIEAAGCVRCDTAEAFVTELAAFLREKQTPDPQPLRTYFLDHFSDEIVKQSFFEILEHLRQSGEGGL